MPYRSYICNICGYVYNEEEGDEDGGLRPGTRFEDIPATWACPVCGAAKKEFSLIE